MAAELVWYASDGVTLLPRLEFGTIMPGKSYFELHGSYLRALLRNDGDLTTNVTVAIAGIGDNDADTYLRLATGVGSPGTFYPQASPIVVGSMPPASEAAFWIDVVVPALAPFASIESAELVATGT
jgi:hypothetical protein